MPVSAETLRKLMAAGLAGDALLDVVSSIDADMSADSVASINISKTLEDRRLRDRERKRRARASADIPRSPSADKADTPSPPPAPSPKEISRTLLENNPSPLPPPQPFSLSAGDEFDRFWEIYPNKVGKADARKKFPMALRKIAIDPMLEALGRYANKTDDRPWLNPSTWLHQERWADQPGAQARGSPGRQREPTAGDIFSEMSKRIEDGIANGRTETGSVAPDEHHLRLVSRSPKH